MVSLRQFSFYSVFLFLLTLFLHSAPALAGNSVTADWGTSRTINWAVSSGNCVAETTYPTTIQDGVRSTWTGTKNSSGAQPLGPFLNVGGPYEFSCKGTLNCSPASSCDYAYLTVVCPTGTTWNGSACVAAAFVAPSSLNASADACGTGKINLSWPAATGAWSYQVYRNGTKICDTTDLFCPDTGLTAGQSYTYTVGAWSTTKGFSTNTTGTSPAQTAAPGACPAGPSVSVTVYPDGATGTNVSETVDSGATWKLTMSSSNVTSCTYSKASTYAGDSFSSAPVPSPNTSYDTGNQSRTDAGAVTYSFDCQNLAGVHATAQGTININAQGASCGGSIPTPNAAAFDAEESAAPIPQGTNWSYSATDTATKCQFTCTSGTWNPSTASCEAASITCGTNAQQYSANTASYPVGGTFCSAGSPTPANPAFPAQGGTVQWQCGSNTVCSASRASAPILGCYNNTSEYGFDIFDGGSPPGTALCLPTNANVVNQSNTNALNDAGPFSYQCKDPDLVLPNVSCTAPPPSGCYVETNWTRVADDEATGQPQVWANNFNGLTANKYWKNFASGGETLSRLCYKRTPSNVVCSEYGLWVDYDTGNANPSGAPSECTSAPAPTPSYTCNAAGTQAYLSWTTVPNAVAYPLRVNDESGVCTGTPTGPNNNGCTSGIEYVNDVANVAPVTINVVPSKIYKYWVHSVRNGQWSPASSAISLVCAPLLSATCAATPSSGPTSTTFVWTVSPSGGTGSYTYSWSGTDSLSGTTASVSKQYSTTGTKNASVTVTSGGSNVVATCSANVTSTLYPDLTISPLDSVSSPANPAAGNSATLSATVKNIGAAAVSGTYNNIIQVDSDANHTNGNEVNKAANTLSNTGINATGSISTTYTFSSAGTYYVRACADNNTLMIGSIPESDDNNNCGNWTPITVGASLSATCAATPSSGPTSTTFVWTVSPSGGTGSYTYSWSGTDSLSGTTASVSKQYSTTGTKNASVTVTSGGLNVVATCSANVTSTLYPDLIISVDPAVYPASPLSKTSAHIIATVRNVGAAAVSGTYNNIIQIDSDANHTSGNELAVSALSLSNTGIGAAADIDSFYTFPSSGTYFIRACADRNLLLVGTIPESDDDNNCGNWVPVTVQGVNVSCSPSPTAGGSPLTVTWTATPSGGTAPYTYSWSGTDSLSGSSVSVSKTYTTNGIKSANVTVTDAAGRTTGAVTCLATVSVDSALSPDLIASSITPISAMAGTVALSATISNVGGAGTSGGFYDLLQQRYDPPVSVTQRGSDADVATVNHVGISAGRTRVVTFQVPLAAGTYYFRVCADKQNDRDSGGLIAESDENNNCGYWTTITVSANLGVSCSPSPASGPSPLTVTWTATPSGGTAPYTYSWSGTDSLSGSSVSVSKTYTTTGSKSATVTVTDAAAQTTGAIACSSTVSVGAALQPDLIISVDPSSSISSPTTSQTPTLSATVKNNGSATASGTFNNIIQIDNDADHNTVLTNLLANTLTNLAAGATGAINTTYTFPSAGTYYMRACADNNTLMVGSIPESDDNNNCGNWVSVAVAAAVVPSLTCSRSPSGTPLSVPVTVTYTATPANGAGSPYEFRNALNAVVCSGSSSQCAQTYTIAGGGDEVKVTSNGVATPVTCGGAFALTTQCGALTTNITATPSRIKANSNTVIKWSATGVNTGAGGGCVITATGDSGFSPTIVQNGCVVDEANNQATRTLSNQATYCITCNNDQTSKKCVTVNIIPSFIDF